MSRLQAVCLLVALIVVEGQDIDIRMKPTPGDTYCGYLQCTAESPWQIIAMTIYNITEKDNPVKLVSISIFAPEISIEQSQIHVINASGTISKYDAILGISFVKAADCVYGSFQCELDFVDANGQPDILRENLTSTTEQNATVLYMLAEITSRLKENSEETNKELNVVKTMLGNVTKDNEVLKTMLGNVTKDNEVLKTMLGSVVEDNEVLKTMLGSVIKDNEVLKTMLGSVVEDNEVLKTMLGSVTKDNEVLKTMLGSVQAELSRVEQLLNSTLSIEQPVRSPCYRGMPHTNAREKFLLYDKVALCDTETDGGGWVIIQRRVRGDVNFYREWNDYKNGFGTPDTDFWIGNDIIHNLTSQGYNELRIDFVYNGTNYFAHYANFRVADESSNYRIDISGFSGNVHDSMQVHNGMSFSTPDRDNDLSSDSCSVRFHGSWWYNSCYDANMNGAWAGTYPRGTVWFFSSIGYLSPLSFTEMKIRY